MKEVEFNGVKYQIGQLDAIKQFHVARRLIPVLSQWRNAVKFEPQTDVDVTTEAVMSERLLLLLEPLAEAIAGLSDDTSEYVINTCLAVVSRQVATNGGFAAVMRGGHLMYSDIDMKTMLGLTVQVITENLGSFFPSAPPAESKTTAGA